MKMKSLSLVVMAALGTPIAAQAADSPHSFTANVGLTSNYVFRGVSQTQDGPAIQGGFDYSHASGFYLGTWASNVSWVSIVQPNGIGWFKDNNSLELDLYGGYRGSIGDFGYDLGAITYYYPGNQVSSADGATDPDTTELYLGASWKFLSFKYSYTVSDRFVGWSTSTGGKTKGSYYVELNGNYDLGSGWGVLGHVGYQDVKDNDPASYTDWKVGVTKDIGFGVVTLAYSDTNADKTAYTWCGGTDGVGNNTDCKNVANGTVFVAFNKSF